MKNKLIALGLIAFVSLGAANEKLKNNVKNIKEEEQYPFPRFGGTYDPSLFLKPTLKYSVKDLEFQFSGIIKTEGAFAENPVMFNSKIPDGYGFFKETLDIFLNFDYGKESFNHSAIEAFANIRQKSIWGNSGKSLSAISTDVKVSDSLASRHSHIVNKPIIWLKDAWLKISLNALFSDDGSKFLHTVKAGYFPFYLGRGIALGTIYGDSKEFLGIYTGYQSDQDAPGINLHGDLIKDRLSYDLYYARLEENCTGLGDTFNFVKAHIIGREATPWRGESKNNDLFAGRIKWKAIKSDSSGTLEFEPYGMYNEESDKKIEVDLDSKISLGTVGLATDYSVGGFEVGGEFAFNMGHQEVYPIDRNRIQIARADDGTLFEQFSHMTDLNDKKARVTKSSKEVATKSRFECDLPCTNGKQIVICDEPTDFKNSADRFRPEYKNRFEGFMVVGDVAYTFKDQDFKVAAATGYASGDQDPNFEEIDGVYKGFIGLQEGYAGTKVPSVFVLDARKLKRPIAIDSTDREAEDDASFTDMIYAGTGFSWFPKYHNQDKLKINPNLLFFWRDTTSKKFDAVAGQATCDDASHFLGTELNLRFKYELLKDLIFLTDAAIFFPGDFYSDTKGLPLSGDVFKKLSVPENTSIDPQDYRLGNSTAWLVNVAVQFKF